MPLIVSSSWKKHMINYQPAVYSKACKKWLLFLSTTQSEWERGKNVSNFLYHTNAQDSQGSF